MNAIAALVPGDDCPRPPFPRRRSVEPIVVLAKAFDYAKKGLRAVLVYSPAAFELSGDGDSALGGARQPSAACLLGCLPAPRPRSTSSAPWSRRCYRKIPAYAVSETGERKRARRRSEHGSPRGLRADGRGTAARASNGTVG